MFKSSLHTLHTMINTAQHMQHHYNTLVIKSRVRISQSYTAPTQAQLLKFIFVHLNLIDRIMRLWSERASSPPPLETWRSAPHSPSRPSPGPPWHSPAAWSGGGSGHCCYAPCCGSRHWSEAPFPRYLPSPPPSSALEDEPWTRLPLESPSTPCVWHGTAPICHGRMGPRSWYFDLFQRSLESATLFLLLD